MAADFSKLFNTASTRAEAAEAVYKSDDFLQVAREAVRTGVIQHGYHACRVEAEQMGGFSPKAGDEQYLQGAFKTLRQEFPDLVSMKIERYFRGTPHVEFSTRPPEPEVKAVPAPVAPPKKERWWQVF